MGWSQSFRSIINPSGGLSYHYSAFRHRRFHWAPFTRQLSEWLESWPHAEGSLLLLGPSAGYSLPTSFLQRFEHIDAVDPDPVARKLFRRNHSINHLTWQDRDDLGSLSREWHPEGLSQLLQDFPDHKILFCNFLGQLPALFPELTSVKVWEQWRDEFQKAISHRRWASYHDLYSLSIQGRLVDQKILRKWERDQEGNSEDYLTKVLSSTGRSGPQTIVDHCTQGLFPTGRRHLFMWQRLPRFLHIIEARRAL